MNCHVCLGKTCLGGLVFMKQLLTFILSDFDVLLSKNRAIFFQALYKKRLDEKLLNTDCLSPCKGKKMHNFISSFLRFLLSGPNL